MQLIHSSVHPKRETIWCGSGEGIGGRIKIAEELGFKTVNLDHYCGYAEMGEGEEIVGIAGHLDIVPEAVTGLMIHLS